MKKQIRVRIEPDDGEWYAYLEDDPRYQTDGQTIRRARENIRNAIALWFQIDPHSFEIVEEDLKLPSSTGKRVAAFSRKREALQRELSEHRRTMDNMVRELVVQRGLSLRDAATLLGISHQRVQQVLKAQRETARAS